MKQVKSLLWGVSLLLLVGCAPVLDRRLMDEGTREFNPSHLVETPEAFKDHLFILGGVIVGTKLTEEGSQIEALFVPVDKYGNLEDPARYGGRFLAIYPKSRGLLDPMIYKKGREITIAGDFSEARQAKIDEMSYTYPVFIIRQIHLWDEYQTYTGPYPYYYYPYAYPGWYSSPWCYDRWGRPFACGPGPFWPYGPW